MKIGLNIVAVTAKDLAAVGRRAEELGFGAIYYGEHIAVPIELTTPYPGKAGYDARFSRLETYVALGYLAAATTTVRLGTGITILPLRHPLQTARSIASVDNLSDGRLELAIGVGSIKDEYDVMGVDFDTRGARLDETLDVFDLLWSQDEPSYQGRFVRFPPIGFEPKPVQKPRPPLYVGSRAGVALERAARRADGWYGATYSTDDVREIKAVLTPMLEREGRDPNQFKYLLNHGAGQSLLPSRRELEIYEAEGVDTVVVSPFDRADDLDPLPKLEQAAQTLGLSG
ncbi:MAG TPA: LLM class F420-dependent oxidoreductase [Mycobacteriales bacterium]|nr:LLM class F420-dependent oxidoreductase [Mycobacteriales bacterium]